MHVVSKLFDNVFFLAQEEGNWWYARSRLGVTILSIMAWSLGERKVPQPY